MNCFANELFFLVWVNMRCPLLYTAALLYCQYATWLWYVCVCVCVVTTDTVADTLNGLTAPVVRERSNFVCDMRKSLRMLKKTYQNLKSVVLRNRPASVGFIVIVTFIAAAV